MDSKELEIPDDEVHPEHVMECVMYQNTYYSDMCLNRQVNVDIYFRIFIQIHSL